MAKPSARAPEIMWCEFCDSQLLGVFLHDVPNHLFADLRSPNHASATNAPKYPTVRNLRDAQPLVDGLLHPIRHRNCTDMPSFPHQIDNRPMVLPSLNVVNGQIGEFSSTKPTSQENCQDGSIPFAPDGVHIGQLPQGTGFLHC